MSDTPKLCNPEHAHLGPCGAPNCWMVSEGERFRLNEQVAALTRERDELRALCREAGDFLATRVTGAMHDKCTHDLCDVRRRAGRLLAKLREQGGEG